MQIIALIHEENGFYGVSFPDFLGCTTVANSYEAALIKAKEVLAFHVEGMVEDGLPLPLPRSLRDLNKDADFIEDKEGAVVALVSLDRAGKSMRINITMDEHILSRVDQTAAMRGESRSGFLSVAAQNRLQLLHQA